MFLETIRMSISSYITLALIIQLYPFLDLDRLDERWRSLRGALFYRLHHTQSLTLPITEKNVQNCKMKLGTQCHVPRNNSHVYTNFLALITIQLCPFFDLEKTDER